MNSHAFSVVCPPDYVKKLQNPSLDFALRASVAFAPLFKNAPGIFVTKGAGISSFFPYTSQTNTTAWMQEVERIRKTESSTTLHAVFTMDGVYAGFAWSKNLPNYGF